MMWGATAAVFLTAFLGGSTIVGVWMLLHAYSVDRRI